MYDRNLAPVCGIYCGNCDHLGELCKGCGYVRGKPFWTVQDPSGVCPLHYCCRNQKKLKHCGLCYEFPCKAFLDLRDPSMTDEQFQESLKTRQRALKGRTKIGTDNWLKEVSSD
ncbi:MAG: DUF3795 domain-containing protein [Spirochaetota bacterium]|nr:DUF3795 domain-containing protein [Spirochaetota bacterium]